MSNFKTFTNFTGEGLYCTNAKGIAIIGTIGSVAAICACTGGASLFEKFGEKKILELLQKKRFSEKTAKRMIKGLKCGVTSAVLYSTIVEIVLTTLHHTGFVFEKDGKRYVITQE